MPTSNEDWKQRGACRDHDPELWFSPAGSLDDKKARGICADCPVLADCAEHSLIAPEPYGIWGGLTEKQRDAMLRKNTTSTPRKSRQGKHTTLAADDVEAILTRLDAGVHLPEVETELGIGREVCRRVWREHRATKNPPRRSVNQQAIAKRAGQSRYGRAHGGNRPHVGTQPTYAGTTK